MNGQLVKLKLQARVLISRQDIPETDRSICAPRTSLRLKNPPHNPNAQKVALNRNAFILVCIIVNTTFLSVYMRSSQWYLILSSNTGCLCQQHITTYRGYMLLIRFLSSPLGIYTRINNPSSLISTSQCTWWWSVWVYISGILYKACIIYQKVFDRTICFPYMTISSGQSNLCRSL